MAAKNKRTPKPAPVQTVGHTSRAGRTKSGGHYVLEIVIDGVTINGEPMPAQPLVDEIADGFDAAVGTKDGNSA